MCVLLDSIPCDFFLPLCFASLVRQHYFPLDAVLGMASLSRI